MLTERSGDGNEDELLPRALDLNPPAPNGIEAAANAHSYENDNAGVMLPPDVEYGSFLEVNNGSGRRSNRVEGANIHQILHDLAVAERDLLDVLLRREQQVFEELLGGHEQALNGLGDDDEADQRVNAVNGDTIEVPVEIIDFRDDEEIQGVWCIEHIESRQEEEVWRMFHRASHAWRASQYREWEVVEFADQVQVGNADANMQGDGDQNDDNNPDVVVVVN